MEKNLSRFRGKLVNMIKDAGSKYDYLILPKIRHFIALGLWTNWERFFYCLDKLIYKIFNTLICQVNKKIFFS